MATKKTAKANETGENSAEWTASIVQQMSDAQKTWLEMATQQSELVFKTVSDLLQASQNAPTAALGDWAKQGIEAFVEAQRKWSEISIKQGEQMIEAMQKSANVLPFAASVQAASAQSFETLVKMRMAWLETASEQNSQVIKAMRESLNIDDSSPIAALTEVAEKTMNNYVEVQKRWLELAMQLPVFGGKPDKK